MNVTRAVLPVMRTQRSGLVVQISSTAGINGGEFPRPMPRRSSASRAGSNSLTPEVAPFGIRTMLVEPGFFRTELLTPESTNYAKAHNRRLCRENQADRYSWNGMNGLQGGDPAKLAKALIQLCEPS